MKTQIQSRKKSLALLGLALGVMFVTTGCLFSSDTSASAEVAGVLQGDVESGTALAKSAAVEGAIVTAHEVALDGSLGPIVAQSQTNAQGAFVLKTDLKGARKLIVRAVHSGQEWKARFEGRLESGKRRACRPLNLESSVDAEVWLELQKTSEGRAVHSSEVNLAVNAEVAAHGEAEFRGTEQARAAFVARAAAAVKAASRARAAFLAEGSARYEANRNRIDSLHASAEAGFNATLAAGGGDTAGSGTAERAYVEAFAEAYLEVGIERTAHARSAEASYHAMIRASAEISDSARTAMARGYARLMGIACDTAMREEFRNAGASQARIDLVVQAGVRLRDSIDRAENRARLDSAMARFRAEVRAAFTDTSAADTTLRGYAQIAGQVVVTTLLDSLSASIQAMIGSSTEGQQVGEAYAETHLQAQADLDMRFESVSGGDEKAEAAANLFAFLSVRSAPN